MNTITGQLSQPNGIRVVLHVFKVSVIELLCTHMITMEIFILRHVAIIVLRRSKTVRFGLFKM